MNILVCVKQVPDTTQIKIDPVKHTLIREGVPAILNPFDGYALEAAARIKDKNPDTKIVVVTMGPPQAVAVLKECVAIAADKGYLVTGRTFGGSDTLATSYIISHAIKKIEETEGAFDAIFCGKQAIDGDTAQVGPEIAEWLGLPQVTYGLECEAVEGGLKVQKEAENGKQIIGIKFPCLVTFTKPSFDPRYLISCFHQLVDTLILLFKDSLVILGIYGLFFHFRVSGQRIDMFQFVIQFVIAHRLLLIIDSVSQW